jgi:hypothetical protein
VLLEEYEVGRDSTVHAITETHSYYWPQKGEGWSSIFNVIIGWYCNNSI